MGTPAKIASVALPLAVLSGGGYGLTQYMGIERPDALGCYQRAGQSATAIWFDASLHSHSPAQLRDYRTGALQAYNRTDANGRVMILSTAQDASGTLVQPVFVTCKPAATEAEQERLSAPAKTAAYLKRRADTARDRFSAELDQAITSATEPDQMAKDSPILEQLASISWQPDFTGPARKLVIVTDGLQNSALAQFCAVKGDMPSYATFAQKSDFASFIPHSFAGTEVSVLLVEFGPLPQRGLEHCSTSELRQWYRDYFTSNGAASVQIKPLRHWAH